MNSTARRLTKWPSFSQAVAATKPGSKVKVIVLRRRKPTELTMTVDEMPVDGKLNFKNTAPSNSSVDRLGLSTRPLNDLEKKSILPVLLLTRLKALLQKPVFKPEISFSAQAARNLKPLTI